MRPRSGALVAVFALVIDTEGSGSGDRCTTAVAKCGSIYGVGGRFPPFRIKDLEMVGQNGIEPIERLMDEPWSSRPDWSAIV